MMNSKEFYLNLNSKTQKYIDLFYEILIEWDTKKFLEFLKSFAELKGSAVTDEMNCYFASELDPSDEDYFGDTGVAFYFDYPAVNEDCIVVLTNKEFYDILIEKCDDYLKIDLASENEVKELLRIIKQKLNV